MRFFVLQTPITTFWCYKKNSVEECHQCSIGTAKCCFALSTENMKESPFLSDNYHVKLLIWWVDSMFSAITAMYLSNSQLLTYVRRVERVIFLLCPFSYLRLEFTFYFLVVDVDGMWGEWGEWSSCSVQFSCQRGGIRRRFVANNALNNELIKG